MFYHYRQGNALGLLYHTARLRLNVIVEAQSSWEANERAKKHGIYFNEYRKEADCEHCGPRWRAVDLDTSGTPLPAVFGVPILVVPPTLHECADTVIYGYGGRQEYGFGADIYKEGIPVPEAVALYAVRDLGAKIVGTIKGGGWRIGLDEEWMLVTVPSLKGQEMIPTRFRYTLPAWKKADRRGEGAESEDELTFIGGVPV